jgi:hypothetical protein
MISVIALGTMQNVTYMSEKSWDIVIILKVNFTAKLFSVNVSENMKHFSFFRKNVENSVSAEALHVLLIIVKENKINQRDLFYRHIKLH